MSSNPAYALTIFRQSDTELHDWYLNIDNPRVSRAQIGREAFECYRLCRRTWGYSWATEIEEAAQALNLVREMFGVNWQEEWQKLKDVAERM